MALDDRREFVSGDGEHPHAELLAQYADNLVDGPARTDLEAHLADCADCRDVLMDTMATFVSPTTSVRMPNVPAGSNVVPFRRSPVFLSVAGLAAAAALVLVFRLAQPALFQGTRVERAANPELQELMAAMASEPVRPVEGRLSMAFPYAPAPSPSRGPADRSISADVRIAAANVEKRAGIADPADRAGLGVAYIVLGDLDRAIAVLEDLSRASNRADVLSDLSAALLARSAREPGDLPRALAVAEQALTIGGAPDATRFNRALALEKLGRREEALQAWRELAESEPHAEWRAEARRRAEALDQP